MLAILAYVAILLTIPALCVSLVVLGGRRLASLGGALLLGPITFVAVGRAAAGTIDPNRTRFQGYPFVSIRDSALIGNLVFWTFVWALILYFVLPKLGRRWRS